MRDRFLSDIRRDGIVSCRVPAPAVRVRVPQQQHGHNTENTTRHGVQLDTSSSPDFSRH